jgi:hypothetical protein
MFASRKDPSSLIFRSPGTYTLNQMSWLRGSRALLFIIFAFWTTGGAHAFSMGLGGEGTVTISAGQGFGPKLQYGGGVSIDFVFPLLEWLRLDASIDGFTVAPSDISGGFLYRGYSGAAMAIMAQAGAVIFSSSSFGVMRMGGGLGLAAALPSYWSTTLAFFYLEPRAEALLDWVPSGLQRFDFQISLPLRFQLRRDLSYSVATGIGIGVLYRFGKVK